MANLLRTLQKSLTTAAATTFRSLTDAAPYQHTTTRGFCKIQRENRNIRDHKRRLLAEKFELRRNLYKAMFRDVSLPAEFREKMLVKLSSLPRSSSFTRVRNRCIFSGRPRAVYRQFRMSRIVFRKLASEGQIMGVKKASW